MGSKYVPKEIKKPVDKVIDFFDEDILDPAGEFLEEQILDPAGEFLGEELAQPLRRQVSKAMPDELQFLAGIGGGKAGAMLAALATGNPFLIAAAAAAGNVAGDYLTTEEDEEYDPDVVSAAFSAITQGLAAVEAPSDLPGVNIDGEYVAPRVVPGEVGVNERLMFDPSTPMGTTPTYVTDPNTFRVSQELATAPGVGFQGGEYVSRLGANAPGYAESVAAASKANEAASFAEALTQGTLEAGTGTALEGARNLGIEFVRGAQPYVDPFTAEAGTVRDILRSGATGMDAAKQIALATGKALVPGAAEFGTKLTIEMREAMQQAEDDYREYLRERGLRADQVRDQSRTLRRQYYIQSFKNRGYSDQEIIDVLLRAKLINSPEEYDPNDLPQDRKFGEDVTDDTLYAARGGRVGFDNGGMGGIGQFVEEQKIREEFMDKMKRGLGAMEMNMKLNDPGLFGRIRNVLNPMDDEPFFYTQEEIRFPDTKRRYESMIQQMDEDRAAADFEMRDKMDLVEDYMNRLDAMGPMGTKAGMRAPVIDTKRGEMEDLFKPKPFIVPDTKRGEDLFKPKPFTGETEDLMKLFGREKNAMGTRTTPEGDPISPDMPNGMQMDLRGGGFIPLGTKPKADDVPAMVGKNEFVLNDEAVSGIGKLMTGRPDPRAGARALYKLQNEMEAMV